MIDFNCPKCGELLSVPDSLTGKAETCPTCGNVCVVARPATVPAPPPRWPPLKLWLQVLIPFGAAAVLGLVLYKEMAGAKTRRTFALPPTSPPLADALRVLTPAKSQPAPASQPTNTSTTQPAKRQLELQHVEKVLRDVGMYLPSETPWTKQFTEGTRPFEGQPRYFRTYYLNGQAAPGAPVRLHFDSVEAKELVGLTVYVRSGAYLIKKHRPVRWDPSRYLGNPYQRRQAYRQDQIDATERVSQSILRAAEQDRITATARVFLLRLTELDRLDLEDGEERALPFDRWFLRWEADSNCYVIRHRPRRTRKQ